MNCPNCNTELEVSIVYEDLYCPNCDYQQVATEEQRQQIMLQRQKYRAENLGIKEDVELPIYEFCECTEETETSYILTHISIDGTCTYQEICDICDKAKDYPQVED